MPIYFLPPAELRGTQVQRGAYSWEPYSLSVPGIFFSEYFVYDFYHAFHWGLLMKVCLELGLT